MNIFKYTFFLLLLAAMASCRKPYAPAAITAANSYLVVEGTINTGPDSTFIKLSKTVNLAGSVKANPVLNALVTIESDQNSNYPLTETANGVYVSPGLNLDNTRQYRLRIKTIDNKQYLSDFVTVKVAPPIDSIGFKIVNNTMQIYLNTHDPNNSTHYYRWDYQETWKFHSMYFSFFVSNGTAIVPRTQAQYIYYCYASDTSSNIILGSSAKLKQDLIYQTPITFVASASEKIELRYSILIRQYALSINEYTFWSNLKTNTEELGSIFDAQPSNINGNIHNIANPSEPVIGYVSACRVQTKRVFIDNSQLPQTQDWFPKYPYYCQQDTNLIFNPKTQTNEVAAYLIPYANQNIITSALTSGQSIVGYLRSDYDCVDCTLRGVVAPPLFWR